MKAKLELLLNTLLKEGGICIITLGSTSSIEITLKAEITRTSVIEFHILVNESSEREVEVYEETLYNFMKQPEKFYKELLENIDKQLSFLRNDIALIESRVHG